MWRTILCLCVCALAALPLLAAPPVHLKADVPFAFHVQDRVMPPGQYELHPVGNAGVISLASENSGKVLVLVSRAGQDFGKPELVFTRLQGRLRLTAIRTRPADTLVKPEFR